MIIVGSSALVYHGINDSKPNDLDVWFFKGEDKKKFISENKHLTLDIFEIDKDIYDLIKCKDGYATGNSIYTIKCSHFSWDIFWDKTKRDILRLNQLGFKLIPELYEALKKVWEKEHGNKNFLSLKKNKSDFFNDYVSYIYDHDLVHELVAYPNRPMYEKCLTENEEVLIDKNLFLSMNKSDQLKLFKEEILVIALERWLFNDKTHKTLLESYFLSLKKVITSLTKNWAADFIIFNLDYYKHPTKEDYKTFKRVLTTLKFKKVNEYMNIDIDKTKDNDKQVVYEFFNYVKSCCYGVYEFKEDEFFSELADGDVFCLMHNTSLYDEWKNLNNKVEDFEKYLATKGYVYEHLYRSDTGGEGCGQYCKGVFSLNGIAYSVEWSYYSFTGYNFDGASETLRLVKPIQKTITIYE